MKTKKVTREEFDAFVNAYPRQLNVDVAGMFEPPLRSWNDFTLGDWPDSVVAKMIGYDADDPDATFFVQAAA